MSLKINYDKVKSEAEAFNLVRERITPAYLSQFKVKTEVQYFPDKNEIVGKGKGFTLTLKFSEQYCEVLLDLSLLLRPVKSKVLNRIEDELKNGL